MADEIQSRSSNGQNGEHESSKLGVWLNALENHFEGFLFGSRWLAAPIYAGLIFAIVMLLSVFFRQIYEDVQRIGDITLHGAVLMSLTLIDLALVANLVLVVVLAGYEHFVSKIHIEDDEDRPSWLKSGNFSGLKLKLFASIIAITGIELLRAFMALRAHGVDAEDLPPTSEHLMWLVIIHVTFLFTALLSALADCLASLARRIEPPEEEEERRPAKPPGKIANQNG